MWLRSTSVIPTRSSRPCTGWAPRSSTTSGFTGKGTDRERDLVSLEFPKSGAWSTFRSGGGLNYFLKLYLAGLRARPRKAGTLKKKYLLSSDDKLSSTPFLKIWEEKSFPSNFSALILACGELITTELSCATYHHFFYLNNVKIKHFTVRRSWQRTNAIQMASIIYDLQSFCQAFVLGIFTLPILIFSFENLGVEKKVKLQLSIKTIFTLCSLPRPWIRF